MERDGLNLGYFPRICLEDLRKTLETFKVSAMKFETETSRIRFQLLMVGLPRIVV
jgi:hypothetical protein